ncbi:uncharacterized protein BDR25DRAFT_93376 [Lindgomyces ingoldianus]|uniref:Uncharacterized protein n=1 Tax=Lindgomyces ingoldianus TaxID=673940 RepID=A0ACB6QFD2_9PLEO|nr:uncharacterized protein BDR25DRAFT_93376 [Lindgomyces ingoldianus]KAF2464841.1 hypothetical protein BDR25DRAFT_93376 [Lindgomyces ingoldianus]
MFSHPTISSDGGRDAYTLPAIIFFVVILPLSFIALHPTGSSTSSSFLVSLLGFHLTPFISLLYLLSCSEDQSTSRRGESEGENESEFEVLPKAKVKVFHL